MKQRLIQKMYVQGIDSPIKHLAMLLVGVVLSLVMSSQLVLADPLTANVTCADGTQVTATRAGQTFKESDYQAACGGRGYSGRGGTSTGQCAVGKGGFSSAIFTPWHKYLDGERKDGGCVPTFPKTEKGNYDVAKGITLILVAVIELLIHVSGAVAAGFIIWGAIQYIISQGNPGKDGQDGIAGAKSTITNAIVGLIIIVVASAGVQFIGSVIK